MAAARALSEGLVVYEEEDEEHGIGGGEGDARDHVDGLCHTDRVRRLFFADLDETWLKEIVLLMKDEILYQLATGLINTVALAY